MFLSISIIWLWAIADNHSKKIHTTTFDWHMIPKSFVMNRQREELPLVMVYKTTMSTVKNHTRLIYFILYKKYLQATSDKVTLTSSKYCKQYCIIHLALSNTLTDIHWNVLKGSIFQSTGTLGTKYSLWVEFNILPLKKTYNLQIIQLKHTLYHLSVYLKNLYKKMTSR